MAKLKATAKKAAPVKKKIVKKAAAKPVKKTTTKAKSKPKKVVKNNKGSYTFQFGSPEELARVHQAAKDRGMQTSVLIRTAINEWLAK